MVLLSVFGWMVTGRVVRGMAMSLRERDYVHAAKFMGVPSLTIIRRHLLPNMASLLIVDVTINVGGTILAETGLSFFGFGVQPPDVSLGTVLVRRPAAGHHLPPCVHVRRRPAGAHRALRERDR